MGRLGENKRAQAGPPPQAFLLEENKRARVGAGSE